MMGYREDSAGNEYGWIRSISLIAFETYIIDESAICFCVGIAQQWGKMLANNSKAEFVYPLQINKLLAISLIREQDYSASSASAFLVREHDNTKAILNLVTSSASAYAYVLIVAIQQWGYCPYTKDNNAKITLPITYAIKHYIAVSSAEDNYGGSINITGIWELTLTDFVLAKSAHAKSAFWISLGCQQQWGTITVYANSQKYTFVIPFNEMCFYCGGIPWKTASAAYCGVAYTVSKTEFEMYYYHAGGAIDVCWIAIGV